MEENARPGLLRKKEKGPDPHSEQRQRSQVLAHPPGTKVSRSDTGHCVSTSPDLGLSGFSPRSRESSLRHLTGACGQRLMGSEPQRRGALPQMPFLLDLPCPQGQGKGNRGAGGMGYGLQAGRDTPSGFHEAGQSQSPLSMM